MPRNMNASVASQNSKAKDEKKLGQKGYSRRLRNQNGDHLVHLCESHRLLQTCSQ